MWGFMICFHINMSMPWTRLYHMSNKHDFVDTFCGYIHVMDMKEKAQNTERPDQISLGGVGYGG